MALPHRSIAIFSMAICVHLVNATTANATDTWRCGNTYTDQACQGGKAVNVNDGRSDADRRAADSATRRNERRADELERNRLRLDREVAERDRRAAADAQRRAIAERRLAANERLVQARIRKMEREPHKSTKAFKTAPAKSGA